MIHLRQILGVLVVFSMVLFLQGCPPPGRTEFRNDTRDAVTVRWAREEVSVAAGTSATVKSYEFPRSFEVVTPRRTWRYVAKYPGQDYMAPGYRFGLRIERDGRIYAFQPHAEMKCVFAHLHGVSKLMAGLLYGSGLRLMECVRLRVHPVT